MNPSTDRPSQRIAARLPTRLSVCLPASLTALGVLSALLTLMTCPTLGTRGTAWAVEPSSTSDNASGTHSVALANYAQQHVLLESNEPLTINTTRLSYTWESPRGVFLRLGLATLHEEGLTTSIAPQAETDAPPSHTWDADPQQLTLGGKRRYTLNKSWRYALSVAATYHNAQQLNNGRTWFADTLESTAATLAESLRRIVEGVEPCCPQEPPTITPPYATQTLRSWHFQAAFALTRHGRSWYSEAQLTANFLSGTIDLDPATEAEREALPAQRYPFVNTTPGLILSGGWQSTSQQAAHRLGLSLQLGFQTGIALSYRRSPAP